VRRDGTIVAWSAGAEQIFNWSPAQALGQPLGTLLICERFRDLQGSAFRRLLTTGERRRVGRCMEISAIRRDGRELPVELTITPVHGQGAPVFDVSFEDISVRRRRELEVWRLAAIVSNSSDAIMSGTVDGTIESWNAGAERLYGYTAEEIIGRSVATLRPDGDLVDVGDAQRRLMAGESVLDFETREIRKDGTSVAVSVSMSPLLDERNTVIGISSIVRDISERKAAEAALSDAQARFQGAFEEAPIGIALVAPGGRFLMANDAYARLFGRSREALLQTSFQAVAHPDDLAAEVDLLESLKSGRLDRYELEQRYLRPDGTTAWGLLAVSMVRDEAGSARYFVRHVQDITARREALQTHTDRLSSLSIAEAREQAGHPPVVSAHGAGELSQFARERLDFILTLARTQLGMEVAYVGEFRDGRELFPAVSGDAASFGLADGAELPLSETYCHRMVEGHIPNVVPDTGAEPEIAGLAVTSTGHIGSYVGVPLRHSDGRLYGALCGIGHETRDDLSERHRELLEFLSVLVVEAIETDMRDQRARRATLQLSEVHALIAALEARDRYTSEHSKTVVELATAVARHLGLDEDDVAAVEHVAMLHDIGKVGIPDSVLDKRGPLSTEEWALMHEHPAVGARIVASLTHLAHLAPSIRAEHERYDGMGYPDGLAGPAIPVASRITFACDAYHAMTSDRPYRAAMPLCEALRELEDNAGSQFDPVVITALSTAFPEIVPSRTRRSRSSENRGDPGVARRGTRRVSHLMSLARW
jgi:PAS domain S-box-containing protein/putative nucleotidyltransferase with HDIG domain